MAKNSKGDINIEAKGTFITGNKPATPAIGGSIKKGNDLRGNPASNKGKMPKSTNS